MQQMEIHRLSGGGFFMLLGIACDPSKRTRKGSVRTSPSLDLYVLEERDDEQFIQDQR